jgi:hypothetical protein
VAEIVAIELYISGSTGTENMRFYWKIINGHLQYLREKVPLDIELCRVCAHTDSRDIHDVQL